MTPKIAIAATYSNSNGTNSSTCASDHFEDLQDKLCKPLTHPEYGFNTSKFNAEAGNTIYNLQNCTESGLRSLLASIGPLGGTVNIPSCTILLNGPLELPSNILFQGAGKANTILRADINSADQLIKLKDKKNIIIRDLSLDADNKYLQTLLIWYADNILLERINVYNSARTAVELRYINKITVRDISANNSGTYHGIVIKDCMNESPIPNLARCESQYASSTHTYGSLWTTDFLIYSNLVYYNKDHGLDIHGVKGEVAGNVSHFNGYGSKFMDSIDLDIHHNTFDGSTSWGSHINISVDVPNHVPSNVAFYNNRFIGSQSDFPIRIADPATNIRLAYNTYSGNVNNKLRITAASANVFVCADGDDAQMPVDGNSPTVLSPSECLKYQSVISPTPTISTPSPSIPPCMLKKNGDANCNNSVDIIDFQIWREEYFSGCGEAYIANCGANDDGIGSLMDANFNGSTNTSSSPDTIVNLVDFEIWRKYYTLP